MSSSLQNNIFNDLATLIEAGISIADAARRISASYPKITAWQQVILQLEKGHPLSRALDKGAMISRYEREVISVAEFAGRLPEGLRCIADSYDQRRSRISRLKSKLYYPFAMFLVAIVVSTILQISQIQENDDTSIAMIVFGSFFWLVIAIIITRTMLSMMQKDACYWLNLASSYSHSQWYKMQLQQVVFGALLWHAKSGIDFKTGFSRVAKLVDSKKVSKQLLSASIACGQGQSVSNSIRHSRLSITPELMQILMTAEQSGRWEESVERYLAQNGELLDVRIDNAFEWAPRLYYGMIVIVAISVIL